MAVADADRREGRFPDDSSPLGPWRWVRFPRNPNPGERHFSTSGCFGAWAGLREQKRTTAEGSRAADRLCKNIDFCNKRANCWRSAPGERGQPSRALSPYEYQSLNAMPVDMPPAGFVTPEPGMSRKPKRS